MQKKQDNLHTFNTLWYVMSHYYTLIFVVALAFHSMPIII